MQNIIKYEQAEDTHNETTSLVNTLKPRSALLSRNVSIFGRRTSVRLESQMWAALNEIAGREQCSIHDLCSLIDSTKEENSSLTAAIRVFLMLYYKAAATENGHERVGHGDIENMKNRARVITTHYQKKALQ